MDSKDLVGRYDKYGYHAHRLVRLHRVVESIPWDRFLGSIDKYNLGLCNQIVFTVNVSFHPKFPQI
jgi:hypothetical protein